MRGVTENGGTAKQAAIEGYAVGGKTGTAQKVANGHYDPTKWVSSFVGVVPAEDPRLVIMVIMDEPQGGHLGGAVAAPIFKEIAEQSLRYLHVPPTVADRREGDGREGCRRQGGGEGRGRARQGAGRRGRGRGRSARHGPAAGRRLAGRRSRAGGKMGRGRRRRGRPGRARAGGARDRPGLRRLEPRPGDPRRPQERRRAGLRRSGGTRDRRGAAPAARARPGAAGCGLPRGVRAQGMTAPGFTLADLLAGIDGARVRGDARVRVAEVRDDSRQVARGDLFIAVPGAVVDGRKFLADAVGRGAAALVVEGEPPAELAGSFAGAVVVVPNARHALGAIARNRFRGASSLALSAVTGTNGKTTTTYIVESMLRAAGLSAGVVGTVSYRGPGVPGGARPAPNTTPGALVLHELFDQMHAGGATDVVLEATSHALAQGRARGLRVPRGGDDEPDAGPPGLSRRHATLRGRQGDPVRAADRSRRAASRSRSSTTRRGWRCARARRGARAAGRRRARRSAGADVVVERSVLDARRHARDVRDAAGADRDRHRRWSATTTSRTWRSPSAWRSARGLPADAIARGAADVAVPGRLEKRRQRSRRAVRRRLRAHARRAGARHRGDARR